MIANAALFAAMGAKDTATAFGAAADIYFPQFEITTPLRIAHFLAQASEETMGFRYLREIWGPTEAQKAYEPPSEKAAELGNTQPGDGFRFRGRGLFDNTGRYNYSILGPRLGLDLINHPELLEQPDAALHAACLYWDDHKLNIYADADNILAVSNGINRGNPASIREPNGFEARKAALAKAKQVLS